MSQALSQTIKLRVGKGVKKGFQLLGRKTPLKAAHHQRQAFREYLAKPEHAAVLKSNQA